jgi:biotin operon repressor
MTTSLFLSDEDLHELTGFVVKAKQIEQLRKQGIPFFVNASGRAKVARAAVEGRKAESQPHQVWKPAVLQGNRKAA